MKTIACQLITDTVARLCIEANYYMGPDIKTAFRTAQNKEQGLGKQVIEQLLRNGDIAAREQMPICQDTGMAVVFVRLGQEVQLTGGLLSDAIQAGVAKGYREGYLRCSVVGDPIRRVNTGDNTPAVIHMDVVAGDALEVTVAPKGFGSENMSALYMLKPAQGIEGVKAAVVETVRKAGPNPCPPVIVGVGVGGTMEKAALLAKEGLLRNVGSANPDLYWDGIEKELLEAVNALDIGPAGLGGVTTALAVHIAPWPTHIAGLPVAVNIGCHVTRHAKAIL